MAVGGAHVELEDCSIEGCHGDEGLAVTNAASAVTAKRCTIARNSQANVHVMLGGSAALEGCSMTHSSEGIDVMSPGLKAVAKLTATAESTCWCDLGCQLWPLAAAQAAGGTAALSLRGQAAGLQPGPALLQS